MAAQCPCSNGFSFTYKRPPACKGRGAGRRSARAEEEPWRASARAQVDVLRCVSRGKRRERRGCQDPWQGWSPCEVAEDFTVCRLSSDCESEGRRGPQTPSRGDTSVGGGSGTLLLSFPRKSGSRLMPHPDLTPSRQGDVVSSPICARRRRRNAMPPDVSRGALHVAFMTVSRYNCSVLLLATIHL